MNLDQKTIQGIQNKMKILSQNLGSNNGFIDKIKGGLIDIRGKLNQVVASRRAFQTTLDNNKKQILDLKNEVQTSKNVITDLQQGRQKYEQQISQMQRDIQIEKGNVQKTMQQLDQATKNLQAVNSKLNAATIRAQQAEQKIENIQRENQGFQQSIRNLDEQINQIATLVETQKRLLDPSNASDDSNLFGHIQGINAILTNILQQGPSTGPDFTPNPNQQPTNTTANILSPQEQSIYNQMRENQRVGSNIQRFGGKSRRKHIRVKKTKYNKKSYRKSNKSNKSNKSKTKKRL